MLNLNKKVTVKRPLLAFVGKRKKETGEGGRNNGGGEEEAVE